MKEIHTTPAFDAWVSCLAGDRAHTKVLARLSNMAEGNFGDAKSVGGVFESRIHHGPGYRISYIARGAVIVILLAGGTKASQRRDVALAKQLAAGL